MSKEQDLLGDITKRAGDLHQQLVKQTLFCLTVGAVLAATLATATTQLRQAGVADLQEQIQSQVSAAGNVPDDDQAWQLFDECGVAPFFARPQQRAKAEAERNAAYAEAQQSLHILHKRCQTLHPFQLAIKLLDYPITIDLMVWGFVLPPSFLFLLAWIFRLRFERTLLIRAGEALSRSVPAEKIPLDAAMLLRETRYGEAMSRQATDWSEKLLILGLFGAAGFVFYRLWLLWAPLDKLLLAPVGKIYGLLAVMLLCVLADCHRRLRDEIAFTAGAALEPAAGWRRMRSVARKVWHSLYAWGRRLPIRGAALAGGILGALSLFLACGMEGCDERPVSGYQLLEVRWETINRGHGTIHELVFRGDWYFGGAFNSVVSEIGRWSYVVGIVLAATALAAVIISLFRRGAAGMVLRHLAFQVLAMSSVLYLCYELAWNDYLLLWWPVTAGAAALSVCFAWPLTRKKILRALARVAGERLELYLTGFAIYTCLLALLGVKAVAAQRFWGILVFFASLVLLATASSLAAWTQEARPVVEAEAASGESVPAS